MDHPGARIHDHGSRERRHMSKIKRFTVWLVSMLLILATVGVYARHETQRAMLRILNRPSAVDTST
jgi:uncharacterized membrane protein YjgN (DUF898 family)